jgi:hypothetical protein
MKNAVFWDIKPSSYLAGNILLALYLVFVLLSGVLSYNASIFVRKDLSVRRSFWRCVLNAKA